MASAVSTTGDHHGGPRGSLAPPYALDMPIAVPNRSPAVVRDVSTTALSARSVSLTANSNANTSLTSGEEPGNRLDTKAPILTRQLHFDPTLDFIATNRVVAVLQKAIERLQLLTLLDTSGSALEGGMNNDASSGNASKGGSEFVGPKGPAMRMAASFSGVEGRSLRQTASAVTAALAVTTGRQHGGRPTVAELLDEQRRLEGRYGELLQATKKVCPRVLEPAPHAQCFSHVTDPAQAALQKELIEISTKLRQQSKTLCTQLKDNPNDVDNWKKVHSERQQLIALLRATVAELTNGYQEAHLSNRSGGFGGTSAQSFISTAGGGVRKLGRTVSTPSATSQTHGSAYEGDQTSSSTQADGASSKYCFGNVTQMNRVSRNRSVGPRVPLSSSYERFARKILQEQAAQQWADELVKKERELNQNVKQLQADLLAERRKKEKEVAERQARIEVLRTQLRNLRRHLKERGDETKARGEAATEGLQRQAADEDRVVTHAMELDKQRLAVEKHTFEVFTQHLKERAAATDELAAQWERKNQFEIKRVETNKIDAKQMRQQCAERLQKCEEEKEIQEEMKKQRDEESRRIADEKQEAEQRRQAEYEAASKLESAIKAMFTRQALAKLKGKSKKKKKAAS